MKRVLLFTLLLSFLGSVSSLTAQDYPTYDPASIEVPYTKFILPNGLRLIVHEDHKAPIVAVNIWYHVGSKNEKPLFKYAAFLFSKSLSMTY